MAVFGFFLSAPSIKVASFVTVEVVIIVIIITPEGDLSLHPTQLFISSITNSLIKTNHTRIQLKAVGLLYFTQ